MASRKVKRLSETPGSRS